MSAFENQRGGKHVRSENAVIPERAALDGGKGRSRWFIRIAAIAAVTAGIVFSAALASADCGRASGLNLAGTVKMPVVVQSDNSRLRSGNASIVGLWHVTYTLPDGSFFFQSFDQFFVDGNEWEGAALGPGAFCQGEWKQVEQGTVHLFHVGWNFDLSGNFTGYFTEKQTEKLSADGNSYQGTFEMKNFDPNGNPVGPAISGTLKATRINGSFSLGG